MGTWAGSWGAGAIRRIRGGGAIAVLAAAACGPVLAADPCQGIAHCQNLGAFTATAVKVNVTRQDNVTAYQGVRTTVRFTNIGPRPIDFHMQGKRRTAMFMLMLAGLGRPEGWPILILYSGWCWLYKRDLRWFVVFVWAVIVFAWFGVPGITNGRPFVAALRCSQRHRITNMHLRYGKELFFGAVPWPPCRAHALFDPLAVVVVVTTTAGEGEEDGRWLACVGGSAILVVSVH